MNLWLKLVFYIVLVCACNDSRTDSRATVSGPLHADPLTARAERKATLSPDILIAWNHRLLALAQAEDQLLTLKGARALSMLHLAVHDALNAIQPRYAAYAYRSQAEGADPIAAAAQAAYGWLTRVTSSARGQQATNRTDRVRHSRLPTSGHL